MKIELPRHVTPKRLVSGKTAYYYNVPTWARDLKCSVDNEPLGTDFAAMVSKAEAINARFDEWDTLRKGMPISTPNAPRYGTVDWLFREYKQTKAFTAKVAKRSRRDYEWAMGEVCDVLTKSGDRIGSKPVKDITPRVADKLYDKFIEKEGEGERLRTGEKLIGLCRKAWRIVRRLYPDAFPKDVPNPWTDLTMKSRIKKVKAAVTREDVYTFAHGAIELGEVEAAAVAVICFEWLQRPENVVGGHIKWDGYRNGKPTIRIEHHKTGQIVDHPLEDGPVKFYEEAEDVLSHLKRLGPHMIMHDVLKGRGKGGARLIGMSTMQHKVQRLRVALNLPKEFTLDACRHGGMTELEEAELTDGQGRALSAHRTQQSYAGYAKRTQKRMLAATHKRHAHRIANEASTAAANETATSCQNKGKKFCQNDTPEQRQISK